MKPLDYLYNYVRELTLHPTKAHLDVTELPEEYRALGEALAFLGQCIQENSDMATALARGNLSYDAPNSHNVLAGPLKSMQGALRHLGWQAERVAAGDYEQRVHGLGEFSDAFNQMIIQLKERQDHMSEEKDEMTYLAYHDALTGLNNRRYALDMIDRLLEEGDQLVMAFIDIDYMKYCNDEFGHLAGDHYILEVSEALKAIPGCEVLCRVGGDEFMAIFPNCDVDVCEERFDEARKRFVATHQSGGFRKSFSYGISDAIGQDDRENISHLLGQADERMYQYKFGYKKQVRDDQSIIRRHS